MRYLVKRHSLITAQEAVHPTKAIRTSLILAAWLGTLLLSRLPQIILSEIGLISPADWSLWWWIVIGVTFIALTFLRPTVRPLREYFLILTVIYVATILRSWLQQTPFWISWFGPEKTWLVRFFGERLGVVLLGMSLAGVLSLLGQKRRNYFLAFGNIDTPAYGMRLSWKIAGPLIALTLTVLVTAGILAVSPLPAITMDNVVPLLPVILILALMNAFGEELAYRAAPISQLWQVVGKKQAIWLTAVWFGLGHYYGGISFGAMGAVFFTLVAVLFGKAMLDTKGLTMPMFIHLWGDVVLFLILALGSA